MAITLRDIFEDDLEVIMRWRMSESVTKYMNTNPKLTIEGQKRWFESLSKTTDSRHWVILENNLPIGLIYLIDVDWGKKNCSWGYYIGEVSNRGLKTAISLELSLYKYLFDELNFDEVHNEVFSLNEGVVKLHLACGNCVTKEVKGEVEKDGIKYDITHLSISKEKWKEISSTKKYEHIKFDGGYEIDHIGIAVQNINNSICEYRALGFNLCGDVVYDEKRGIQIAFVKNMYNDLTVELIQPQNEKTPVDKILEKMNGLASPYHICYKTNNIERTINEFKARHYVISSILSSAPAFNNRRVVFLVKKDAGMIELVEV